MSAVLAWGKANEGALGLGGSERTSVTCPHQVPNVEGKDVQHINCGEKHTLVCLKDGSVLSCGANDFNQCGRDSNLHNLGRVEGNLKAQKVIQVCAGASHSVVLTQAHEVMTWGTNEKGQLGRGDVSEQASKEPKIVKTLAIGCHSIIQVACGSDHTLVLTNAGLVGVWGSNSYGQLGIGLSVSHANLPEFITCLKGIPIAQVAAGGNHSFVLSKSGAIYGWGRNTFGQLGVNDNKDHELPRQCRPMRTQRIKYICCGENHTACLTLDGRVFTFGSGSYGQLGHNSYNNEVLPKQVLELSGSVVSQIACGRGHTLAYVPRSGTLYAFGLGGSGQLGLTQTNNCNSPFAVKGMFSPGSRPDASPSSMQVDSSGPNLRVRSIYAGGDHSFLVAQDADVCESDDHRVDDPSKQILTLSSGRLEKLRHLTKDECPPSEISDEITKIFSSASCLNGSFLLPGEEHFGSSSKKHSVNMVDVRKFFQELSRLSNVVIIQQISTSIEQTLIPLLPTSPPDVEALRLYLMLPECHLFEEPKLYSSIICPLAESLLALDKVAQNVFDTWWPSNQPSYFNRLVTIYKSCIEYLLQLPNTSNPYEVKKRQKGLFVSMEMLQKLNKVNEDHNQIIAHSKFYVPDLKDRVNISEDYISWVQQTQQHRQVGGVTVQGLHFCNYPFLFDGAAKSVLLQTDAALQMQHAIEQAHRFNFIGLVSGMSAPLQPFDPINPCLILIVQRDNLVRDTLTQLQGKNPNDFKKPLKVIFQGEEAVDEGGVRKEFFMLLLREVMDPIYGMFKTYSSNLQWFNSSTFEGPNMFHMIGTLCGLAIYNFTIIDLHFPLALFKKLLKKQVLLDDLLELMPDVGRNLQSLLEYEGDDFEDLFCLNFEIMQDLYGETKPVELCPGGKNKEVDNGNKHEYVNLYVDFLLNKSVHEQFTAFSEGFHSVCGGVVLDLFHPQELQAMVVGNENYDFEELEKNTTYKGEYFRQHKTINFFWEVFHEMSLVDKKKFLLFLTGSDRIPVFGMKYLKMIIQPTGGGEDFLPVAHTCFNVLDLPKYTTRETLKQKLLLAIQQTEGFGLV